MDRAEVRWQAVVGTGGTDALIGAREGHGCCVVTHPVSHFQYALVVGGYVDGDVSADIIACSLGVISAAMERNTLPPVDASQGSVVNVSWEVVGTCAEVGERDGASLVTHPGDPSAALCIMGMSGDVELLNDVWLLRALDGSSSSSSSFGCLTVRAEVVAVSGALPCARFRHAAVSLPHDGSCIIFGGDAEGRLLNDCHLLDTRTWTWRELDVGARTCPMPRALPFIFALPLVASCDVTGDDDAARPRCRLIVAGGALYPEPGVQASLADTWAADICDDGTVTWSQMPRSVLDRPTNGGAVVRCGSDAVALLCGKDADVGDDSVRIVRCGGDQLHVTSLRSRPWDDRDATTAVDWSAIADAESRRWCMPHWRYLTAAVCWAGAVVDGSATWYVMVVAGHCRHPDVVASYAAVINPCC